MRLQKQRTREVKGKEYFRWTVVIPPSEVEDLGWKEGEDLVPKDLERGLSSNLMIPKANSLFPSHYQMSEILLPNQRVLVL